MEIIENRHSCVLSPNKTCLLVSDHRGAFIGTTVRSIVVLLLGLLSLRAATL
jgi:hypothetical protein